jgi:drug/metabolite transporter (DMT)-like permease
MSKKVLAHLALFAVNLMYGANYVVAKGVMPKYVGPNGFILMRVTGAIVLFWTILLFRFQKVAKKDLITLAICGFFGVGMNQLLFFNGLMRTSPLNASIIMTMTPIIVFILSIIILKEKSTKIKVIGIGLGAFGSISLTLLSKQAVSDSSSLGDLFILLNAISYSIYLVLVKPLMVKYKPITVISWVFTFGFIFVLIWPFSIPEFSVIDWPTMPTDIPWRILFVVIGVTFLPYLLMVFAMKDVTPSVASSYIYFQPVLAGIFIYISYSIGSDDYTSDFSIWKLFCALVIFIGVYLVSKSPKKKINT